MIKLVLKDVIHLIIHQIHFISSNYHCTGVQVIALDQVTIKGIITINKQCPTFRHQVQQRLHFIRESEDHNIPFTVQVVGIGINKH